jgi:glycerol-3-phosphate acyltransferase PlsX
MRIIVDAMGGDYAPKQIIEGCVKAAEKVESEILLCGNENVIKQYLAEIGDKGSKIKIHATTEVIESDDIPTKAIRSKKDSSMVVGLNLLKEEKGDVFISAGNTGALMAGALFIVGRLDGVDRPALAPLLPSQKGPVLLVDAGSNANCRPENLVQFAIMGSIYMQANLGIENPKVGLVNIGSEEIKGTDLTKHAYELLQKADINFVGNIEGRGIPLGEVDIAVCDGFVGNVILKLMEGMGKTISQFLKEEINKSFIYKFGGFLLMPVFKAFKKKMDYTEYGGALYLGINQPVIKCHGSSNAKAVMNAIIQAEGVVKSKIVEKIKENLAKYRSDSVETGK